MNLTTEKSHHLIKVSTNDHGVSPKIQHQIINLYATRNTENLAEMLGCTTKQIHSVVQAARRRLQCKISAMKMAGRNDKVKNFERELKKLPRKIDEGYTISDQIFEEVMNS